MVIGVKVACSQSTSALIGVLAANKSELRGGVSGENGSSVAVDMSRVELTKDDGMRMAAELGLEYFETSAVSELLN